MWYEDFPQRRQIVCDLLWRFPNEVVPLVIVFGKSEVKGEGVNEKEEEGEGRVSKRVRGSVGYVQL